MSDLPGPYSYDAPSTYTNFKSFHEAEDSWFDGSTATDNDSGNCKRQLMTPHPKARRSARLSVHQRSKQMAKIRAERRKEEQPPNKRQRLNFTSVSSSTSLKLKPRLTLPLTPTVLKRSINVPLKIKNSEEQELEKMQQLQQELAEKLKKNEVSMKSALSGAGQLMKKLPVLATKPIDARSHTDHMKRLREETSNEQYKFADFTSKLHKHPPSPVHMPKGGCTIPKPFNLSQGRNKRKHDYISTAEQVLTFSKKTPQRFHFCERSRWRFAGYKFKVHELNTKNLEGSPILPNKPAAKEPTKPIGFNLEIEKRVQQQGVPEKKVLPLTVPQSNGFALKNRQRVKEPAPILKANPMPHYRARFKPKRVVQREVEMCPFSFIKREQQRMEVKKKKLDQLKSPEVYKFKARPLPHFYHTALPEKKVKELTHQETLHLQINKHGEQKLPQQIKEEQKQQKEVTAFKECPNTVTHEPFVPKKDDRSLTVQEDFELATERRAREFEGHLAEMEAQKCLYEEPRHQEK